MRKLLPQETIDQIINDPQAQLLYGAQGFIRVVEVFGDDTLIERAARVSYANSEKRQPSKTAELLDYLLRHDHGSPFEMPDIIFHYRVPILVQRQLIRYRVGNAVNEQSGRYVELTDDVYVPLDWRGQSTDNKQGSSGVVYLTLEAEERFYGLLEDINSLYHDMTSGRATTDGTPVAKELARLIKPVGTFTEVYYKVNLRAMMHFLKQRLAKNAQDETSEFAKAMLELAEPHFPLTFQAFRKHMLEGVHFSGDEREIINESVKLTNQITVVEKRISLLDDLIEKTLKTPRRIKEFKQKFSKAD